MIIVEKSWFLGGKYLYDNSTEKFITFREISLWYSSEKLITLRKISLWYSSEKLITFRKISLWYSSEKLITLRKIDNTEKSNPYTSMRHSVYNWPHGSIPLYS